MDTPEHVLEPKPDAAGPRPLGTRRLAVTAGLCAALALAPLGTALADGGAEPPSQDSAALQDIASVGAAGPMADFVTAPIEPTDAQSAAGEPATDGKVESLAPETADADGIDETDADAAADAIGGDSATGGAAEPDMAEAGVLDDAAGDEDAAVQDPLTAEPDMPEGPAAAAENGGTGGPPADDGGRRRR